MADIKKKAKGKVTEAEKKSQAFHKIMGRLEAGAEAKDKAKEAGAALKKKKS